ncbi:hypothetical protein [Flavobacterium maritimum]|uniref:hypothetical protein n=1 Tax=Flavobacterium maritimum TaxID=3149042 RepID=UPI0032B34A0B
MKHYKTIIIITILLLFTTCGKNNEKETDTGTKTSQATVVKTNRSIPVKSNTPKSETITTNTVSEIKQTKNSKPKIKKNNVIINKEPQVTGKAIILNTSPAKKPEIKYDITFLNFKKLLTKSKVGQTITNEQLIKEYNMPEEGVKLIKSIVKVSENELAFKWKSTWMVEKVSDAEFEDATLKVEFRDNNMYTSGDAIGIKYNNKIYNNLILKNGSAYIPSVKGYHWEIRK